MSLELNKIAAAVLTGGVIAMASGFAAHLLVPEHELEESVYHVAGLESATDATVDEGPTVDPVLALLADANVEDGQGVAKKCTACHTFEEGGANKVGPNLYGIVGAKVGHRDDFSYSDGLLGSASETWTYEALSAFLANPKDYAPGTKMSFAGISKPADRAALIAYLRSLSASPLPLPSPEESNASAAPAEGAASTVAEAASDAASAVAEAAGSAVGAVTDAAEAVAGAAAVTALMITGDAENGQKVARKCAACHSFDEGGPNKVGPNLYGVVGADIANHEGYRYSDALAAKEGAWDFGSLDSYLKSPKEFAPGTKMTFAGISNDQDRADLILYLRSLSASPAPLPEKDS
ncbi:c-type cytochrome [Limibacillus halophilus]|uniref:Cytochrome c n=1 Tax=Limibacillus halophilus TaxID=1579333 RepID=A0A839SWP5_9PROT|nr:cytochrome c family protein [Limibacillus halophilus]MBB3066094.1 cytochrome c [Limibacillus halophilus]